MTLRTKVLAWLITSCVRSDLIRTKVLSNVRYVCQVSSENFHSELTYVLVVSENYSSELNVYYLILRTATLSQLI